VRPVAFDARVVAASQQSLSELVAKGSFREDLAARLDGLSVAIPPLRERREDTPSLFAHFLEQHSGGRAPTVTVKLFESLCLYPWPANVRELELLARRLLATHGLEPLLRGSHLPSKFHTLDSDAEVAHAAPPSESRGAHDYRLLVEALEKNGGNVKLAAETVGISRQRAYRVMKQHGAVTNSKSDAPSNGSSSRPESYAGGMEDE
jgi:DNA-binding NtrC family response regulator